MPLAEKWIAIHIDMNPPNCEWPIVPIRALLRRFRAAGILAPTDQYAETVEQDHDRFHH